MHSDRIMHMKHVDYQFMLVWKRGETAAKAPWQEDGLPTPLSVFCFNLSSINMVIAFNDCSQCNQTGNFQMGNAYITLTSKARRSIKALIDF